MTPAFTLQVCGWLVGVPLQFLLLAALVRTAAYRQYPFLFAYAVVNFLSTAIEVPTNIDWQITHDAARYRYFARIYWIDEWILQFLIFALVISLVWQAAVGRRDRRAILTILLAGTLLIIMATFWIEFRPEAKAFGVWMTPWTRDLNISAAVLDLALWTMLIAARKRDPRLLLVSGALGLQFTGEAIGQAVRQMSIAQSIGWVSQTGSAITMVADLACLFFWWRAFRTAPARGAGST